MSSLGPQRAVAGAPVQCWASSKSGVRCTHTVTPRPGEGEDPIPYCGVHLRAGDGLLRVVQHATDDSHGALLVARRALPKGYRMVYWGNRTRCPYLHLEVRVCVS